MFVLVVLVLAQVSALACVVVKLLTPVAERVGELPVQVAMV
jgi:hypothetical protein